MSPAAPPRRVSLIAAVASLFACALTTAGCDSRDDAAKAQVSAVPAVKPGDGVVRGTVTFAGTAPEMAEIANVPCHDGAPPLKEETVVVDPATKGLANVVVYLKGVRASEGVTTDKTPPPPVLDQVHCRYTPHVVAVEAGRPLVVRSSDDAMHNVHYAPAGNPAANFGMTGPGQEKTVTFAKPELAVRVKCDVHPWMTAYVAVMGNPWFAVTDAHGKFEVSHLPAGTYTLAAWHERYGEVTRQVTVGDGTGGDVAFEYKP